MNSRRVLAVLGLSSCAFAGGGAHPVGADLYVEIVDAASVERAYAAAPMVRFCADDQTQKIATLIAGLGADVPALFRKAAPRLSSDSNASPFTLGELRSMSISLHGVDRVEGAAEAFTQRAELLISADFATDAAAARMSTALVDAGWLGSPESQDATNPATPVATAAIQIDGKRVEVARHRWSAFGLTLDAWSAHSGTHWWLGAGRATPETLAARLSGAQPSLTGGDALFGATPANQGTLVARLHADLDTTPSLGADAPKLAESLLPALLPFVGTRGTWSIDLRDGRFVTESRFVKRAPPSLLDQLVASAPLPANTADYASPEAVGVWCFPLDPAGAVRVARDVIFDSKDAPAASTPSDVAAVHERIATAMTKALGTKACVTLLPFAGVSLQPRVLATFELRDRAAFEGALGEIEALLKKDGGSTTVSKRVYHKVPMFSFSAAGAKDEEAAPAPAGPMGLPIGDPTANVRPTIAVLDDRVIVGLGSSYVRAEIQRLEKKGADASKHALAADGRIPAGASEASSIDWGGLVGKLYDMARGFAPMLAQQQGGEGKAPDFSQLPPASALTRFFPPSISITRRLEDGSIATRSESAFGPETPLAMFILAAGIQRKFSEPTLDADALAKLPGAQPGGSENFVPDPETSSPDKPRTTPSVPPKNVERDATLASLRAVKTGLAVYRAQIGSYPTKLATLVEPTTDFPQGFLDAREVPKDAWSRPLRYEVDAASGKPRLWSLGPDGVDQAGAGDDVVAP